MSSTRCCHDSRGFAVRDVVLAGDSLTNLGAFGFLLYCEGVTDSEGVAALNGVVALFNCFRVAKALFLAEPFERPVTPQSILPGFLTAGTILLGICTAVLQIWAESGAASFNLVDSAT